MNPSIRVVDGLEKLAAGLRDLQVPELTATPRPRRYRVPPNRLGGAGGSSGR